MCFSQFKCKLLLSPNNCLLIKRLGTEELVNLFTFHRTHTVVYTDHIVTTALLRPRVRPALRIRIHSDEKQIASLDRDDLYFDLRGAWRRFDGIHEEIQKPAL